MQLHQITKNNKDKKKKRIGRGGKRGTYSGRGVKGQNSRAGRNLQPIIREVIKRHPKLKGYRQEKIKNDTKIINIDTLEKEFKKGESVNPEILTSKKIVKKINGRIPSVKILGRGNISKDLIIEKCKVSESAKEKIEKSGGAIK